MTTDNKFYFSNINKPECFETSVFYIILKSGDNNSAETFVKCFQGMKDLLQQVSKSPDDYIKHHDKADLWLTTARHILNTIEQ